MKHDGNSNTQKSLISFLMYRRWIVIALIGLCTIGFAIPLSKMGIDMDNRPERFAPEGDMSFVLLEQLQQEFGRDDYFVLLMKGDVWSAEYLQNVEKVHKEIQNGPQPPPETLFSLYNAPIVVKNDGFSELVREGKDYQQFASLKKESQHLQERLVNKQGTWSALWCQAPVLNQKETADYLSKIQEIARNNSTDDFSVLVGGVPTFSHSLDALTKEETEKLGAVAFGLMVVFLALWFRRFSMVIGPYLVMVLGIVWTYGVMAIMGVTLSYMTSILPGFLISVCVGDAMHLQALVHDDLRRGRGLYESIVSAFHHAWKPVLLTTLTTAGGLLSFQVSNLPSVQELGTFGAIGVVMACVLSMTLIPAILTFTNSQNISERNKEEETQELSTFLGLCVSLSKSSKKNWVFAVFAVLFCFALMGVSQLKIEHEPLSWLPDEHPTKVAMDILDTEFGGSAELTIWVKATDNKGVLSFQHLQDLYELEERILNYSDPDVRIRRGIGVLDTLRLTYEIGGQSERNFDELIQDQGALSQFIYTLNLSRPNWAAGVLSKDGNSTKTVYRLNWQPAQNYIPLRNYLHSVFEEFEGRGLSAHALGVLYTLLATFGILVDDLLLSFGFAVAVISILMFAFLRDLRLSMISLVPNLLPVIMTLGCMGFLGIPLDLGTVLFASIVLGICIDDTIHLLYHFRNSFRETGDVDQAIFHAIKSGGTAIFVTSLLLFCCMGVYLFSSMANFQRFGALMLISVSFALICDLMLTPILLRSAFGGKKEIS